MPSLVKGVNGQLQELSLFGGVRCHLKENCLYGYIYGVLHSIISTFEILQSFAYVCGNPETVSRIDNPADWMLALCDRRVLRQGMRKTSTCPSLRARPKLIDIANCS